VAIQSVMSDCNYAGSIDIFDPNGNALPGGTLIDELDGGDPVLLGWVSERRLLLLSVSGSITNPAQAGVWETTLDGKPVRLIIRDATPMYGATNIVDATASARGAIVFVRSGSSGDIRLLLAHGRSVHLVYGDRPDWAPDARRLVFQRGGDLWIIDSRTRRVRPPRFAAGGLSTFWGGEPGLDDWVVPAAAPAEVEPHLDVRGATR
jgi:hypothetical protein